MQVEQTIAGGCRGRVTGVTATVAVAGALAGRRARWRSGQFFGASAVSASGWARLDLQTVTGKRMENHER